MNEMTITEFLDKLRSLFGNERDKGTAFELLVKKYLENEPKYAYTLENVWMWKDFPYRGNIGDTGIDLVARTYQGEFWAIQCKFYDPDYQITKADVDTFLATSSKMFEVNNKKTKFSYRLIVSTTDKYNSIAEETLRDQDPQVGRIGIADLQESQIDWSKYSSIYDTEVHVKNRKTLLPHQKTAVKDVLNGFENHDRGKLIMACGTGKTFTSLKIAEQYLNGKGTVLFLIPSIALASQTITEWTAQCSYGFDAAVVCSDNKASKGENSIELGFPSTTDVNRLVEWYYSTNTKERPMNFIFSTYQSIDVVSKFQKQANIEFDLIICDEAHRTTGVTLSDEDESSFVKVHNNDFIKGKKRLYMTATPRIYADTAKMKSDEANATLCSMDDETIYGPEFHRLGFGEAVKQGLLTDYKVLILAVDEEYVKRELQDLLTDENHELKLEDSVKIMGCWNGLSKISLIDDKDSFSSDPFPMKRAVSFCNTIRDSKKIVEMFNLIQEHVKGNKYSSETSKLVNISIEHVDGTFNALEKKDKINWLKDNIADGNCRILTNARCLSEGVDVPALDAVMFLNPRSSMVDIIQSVGRVMRKSPGKNYGYVILPIGISANENPEDALDNNEKYKMVWQVLQALRAHDDRFNNTINKIELNKKKPDQIEFIGIGSNKLQDKDTGRTVKYVETKEELKRKVQMELNFADFDEWRENIYSKMVKKVGSRIYWETWAKDIAEIAQAHIDRIKLLLEKRDPDVDKAFKEFVNGLRLNLNNSITDKDATEMLAQHMITKPVFDALFDDYEFVKNNPVSQTMQKMMNILDKQMLDSEKEKLNKFYASVKERAEGIDNSEGKQKIISDLYEKFFKTALPKEVEKLGIVYTPTECVDFIINSVEYLMKKEFNKSLSNHGVHIIDGFTGTGTFIVRLLQSGVIKKEDLLYKYTNDIHANEIVLLAYYIAAINIEEVFHELSQSENYIPFDGIVLTDTFQLYENYNKNDLEWTKIINELSLPENSERAKKQRELPITVCIGNPPYSVGQKSQNDNAQNLKYPKLDERVANTYVINSKAQLNKATYDAYIKAFRWATDRLEDNGIISFITNGAFIDNKGMDGFRESLLKEFTSIYIFNLRGNARTSGEERQKEGGGIFGSGSRTPVAITCLVKNSNKENDNYIHYYDIGDYLNRDQKLNIISEFKSIENIDWKKIKPDENNDWINKRNSQFSRLNQLIDNKSNKSVFKVTTSGVTTARDAWAYNFSKKALEKNMNYMIDNYNDDLKRIKDNNISINSIKSNVTKDEKKISWSRALLNSISSFKEKKYDPSAVRIGLYRPFCKEWLYYSGDFNENQGKTKRVFNKDNLSIIVTGASSGKDFSALVTDTIFNFHTLATGMSFPLYYYDEKEYEELQLFTDDYSSNSNITDQFLNKVRQHYNDYSISPEDVFNYIYAILYSKDYRKTFEADLKKSLPNIPLVESYQCFKEFANAGSKLIELHINYERVKPYNKCNIVAFVDADYKVTKMKFSRKGDKSSIDYNDRITIADIPLKAYDFVLSGKSAIEWVMERYTINKDSKSNILNDPNQWCEEMKDEKYIFNLLLRVINVSIQTIDIVNSLPKIEFE